MKTHQNYLGGLITLAVLIGLGGCTGMSRQEQSTLAGVGFGGVAGSLLTDGSAIGTIGGAAVGGVIGHEVGNDRRDDRYRNDGRDYRDNRYVGDDRYNDRRGDRYRNDGRDDRNNRYNNGRRYNVSDRSDRSNRSVGYGNGDWFGN